MVYFESFLVIGVDAFNSPNEDFVLEAATVWLFPKVDNSVYYPKLTIAIIFIIISLTHCNMKAIFIIANVVLVISTVIFEFDKN